MIAVFLADGFEEIEALATVDILRRGGLPVKTIGIGGYVITGAHGIQVVADIYDHAEQGELFVLSQLEAVVLPGGMPGTVNLESSDTVQEALHYAMQHRLPIGAICAAPSILGHNGYLKGCKATCYPGFEEELQGAVLLNQSVVTDGNFTTASGAGVAVDFALELVARLSSKEKAEQIRSAMQCP